ncbi:hypothetical protein GCM10007937_51730 [Mesorhizobium albiziae]|nr:hypothetical protein GCM10007937_51730 [Mesorhizobium albiziae]
MLEQSTYTLLRDGNGQVNQPDLCLATAAADTAGAEPSATEDKITPIQSPSPPPPDELSLCAILRGKQRCGYGTRQSRIVEFQPEIFLGLFAFRPFLPGIADSRPADQHAESGCIVVVAVVIRDEAEPGVEGERADVAGPAAVLAKLECAGQPWSCLRVVTVW